MKFNFNKKYISIGIIAFLVIVCSILFFFAFFQIEIFKNGLEKIVETLKPVIFGMIFAYLLTPIVNFFERKVFFPLDLKKNSDISTKRRKVYRILSIIITILIIAGLITLFIKSVAPQIGNSISKIYVQFPVYLESLQKWVNSILSKNAVTIKNFENFFNVYSKDIYAYFYGTIVPEFENIFKNLSSGAINAIKNVWHIIIGAIISIYVLLNKEVFAAQAKKITYSLFSIDRANLLIKDTRFISDTFIGFISGKIIDSAIIGMLCFIGCTLLNMPYSLLISVIIGVTNIIPFFGPIFGAIPAGFIVLMVDPLKCLYFIIFVIILQQLDGNVIGPKILGDSTGISGFWVIFSITFFGSLWGIVGMFIGIPFFAVIFAMIKRNVERKLKKKNLPQETWEYAPLKRINPNGEFVQLYEADIHNFEYKPKEKEKLGNTKKIKTSFDRLLNKDAEEIDEFVNDEEQQKEEK